MERPDFAAIAEERYQLTTQRVAFTEGAEYAWELRELPPVVRTGGLEIHLEKQTTKLDGRHVRLGPMLRAFMLMLAEARGEVVTNQEVVERLWGSVGDPNGPRVAAQRLRAVIGYRYIGNEWGIGYRLEMLPVEVAA